MYVVVLSQRAQIFRDVGFEHVEAEDRTEQFVGMLTKELQYVEENKHDLIKVRTIIIYINAWSRDKDGSERIRFRYVISATVTPIGVKFVCLYTVSQKSKSLDVW